jgi:hypothetical protein
LIWKERVAVSVVKFYETLDGINLLVDPPKPAEKHLPDWYKKQPAALGDFGSTIKRCMPIFDVMTSGYMLVLPCDIYIDSTNPKGLSFFTPPNIMDDFQEILFASHVEAQYLEYPTKPETYHKQLLRIDPFYAVGTERGYSALFTQPFHSDPSPLQVFPAIVDTDTFISSGHYSFFVEKDFKGTIKQGTPIIQVIPFKRDSFSSETVPYDKALKPLTDQNIKARGTFINGYKNKFRSKKEYK